VYTLLSCTPCDECERAIELYQSTVSTLRTLTGCCIGASLEERSEYRTVFHTLPSLSCIPCADGQGMQESEAISTLFLSVSAFSRWQRALDPRQSAASEHPWESNLNTGLPSLSSPSCTPWRATRTDDTHDMAPSEPDPARGACTRAAAPLAPAGGAGLQWTMVDRPLHTFTRLTTSHLHSIDRSI
jgi:hypothetical protein